MKRLAGLVLIAFFASNSAVSAQRPLLPLPPMWGQIQKPAPKAVIDVSAETTCSRGNGMATFRTKKHTNTQVVGGMASYNWAGGYTVGRQKAWSRTIDIESDPADVPQGTFVSIAGTIYFPEGQFAALTGSMYCP